jgi:tetratricopeptide (TPR) repeat protein
LSKTYKDVQEFLGEKVLLVIDPSQNYRSSVRNFLTNMKVKNFRMVSTVAEAKREMLAVKIGFFICEWQLQEKNGLAFCRELRRDKQYKTTPFMLLSTENFRKDVILASEGGVNGYLIKPFSYEDFSAQLLQLINQSTQPNPVNVLLERAEGHLDQGEHWIAETLIMEALNLKATSARAHCLNGRIQVEQNQVSNAKMSLAKAIELNPDYMEAYRLLLQLAESENDPKAVIEMATKLHILSPENPKYPLLLAKGYIDQDNLLKSEHFFKMAVQLSPTLVEGYRGLGNVYLKQKEYEKASKALEKALDLEKGDVPTLNSLGMSYVRQGLVDEGIRRYKLALAIDTNDARVHFNLGLAYEEKGDITQAKESFRKALANDPSMDKAKRQIDRLTKGIIDGGVDGNGQKKSHDGNDGNDGGGDGGEDPSEKKKSPWTIDSIMDED